MTKTTGNDGAKRESGLPAARAAAESTKKQIGVMTQGKQSECDTEVFERSLCDPPRSLEAFTAINAICEEHLQGEYELEVIDIYQHPVLARDEQIIAVPTLLKKLPKPLRRLIGNLSNEERVLLGLNIRLGN